MWAIPHPSATQTDMPESVDSTIPTGASSTDKDCGMLFQTTFDVKIGQIHFNQDKTAKRQTVAKLIFTDSKVIRYND